MINIKDVDLIKTKIDENAYEIVFVYYTGYMTVKNLSQAKLNGVNLLYLPINKINGDIKESNGNYYFLLVPTYESKDTLKLYEILRNEIRDLTRPIINRFNNDNEKYMKVKLNSIDHLP